MKETLRLLRDRDSLAALIGSHAIRDKGSGDDLAWFRRNDPKDLSACPPIHTQENNRFRSSCQKNSVIREIRAIKNKEILNPNMSPTLQKDIIELLRDEKRNLPEKFGLISIGLFGSHAKGNQSPESDVDLLVELSEARFDSLAGLQIYLRKFNTAPCRVLDRRDFGIPGGR